MLAADLKYNIKIEVRTEGKDTLGTVTETWDTLGERRASMKNMTGTSNFEDDISDNVHSFNMIFMFRYISGFNYKCRIKYEDEIYIIKNIETLRRREGYKVVAERRANV